MNDVPFHRDSVLVVDDQPESLRMLTDTLESSGISVLVATSGQGALDLMGHIVPDLVLMDAVMPGMDGFEATARIKANPATRHVPVIFMTGLTESEHVIEGFEVGGVDYVRKPVNVHELLARVRVHLGHARAVQVSTIGLDATGRMMLATDLAGRFLWCSPLAESVIARLQPGWNSQSGQLPDPVRQTIERLLQRRDTPGTTLRIDWREDAGDYALELVLIAQYRENEVLIRLNQFDPEGDAAKLQTRLGLTEREAEVLLWISYGKSNADISEVLAISPRTVQKHLERIYEKLGVETRAAAAAIAIRSAET
ncbi:response regulator transcription factor [Novosphingobium acidiphilum]|uniref:response regulator transcription factor n=1 Tax=Novosphingobium acidiphilum TaxID=505248 RepID=UPI0003FA653C|nr:response regulator transcription factor [Novosphingobium acidiphilum]